MFFLPYPRPLLQRERGTKGERERGKEGERKRERGRGRGVEVEVFFFPSPAHFCTRMRIHGKIRLACETIVLVPYQCDYPIPIPQVRYEYETSDHVHLQVYERTLESPYSFSIPAQVGQRWLARGGVAS